ncbi:MAG: hypothetical protein MJZ34_00300 [Paludibacteraceae bacterium]|nr:hypothetical protein [Paludibacteraceae bacterium]
MVKILKTIVVFFFLFSVNAYSQDVEKFGLRHVKGSNQIGLRVGKGTKNKIAYGITYDHYFNTKTALAVEIDQERAVFGKTDFYNLALLGIGVDFAAWRPINWLYIHVSGAGCVGADRWSSNVIDLEKTIIVYGINVGGNAEFFCNNFISLAVKAQQYFLTGEGYTYFKPNFSLSLRFNF